MRRPPGAIDDEVDLGACGRPVEARLGSTAPGLGRGFQLACDDIGATLKAVIHGGSEAFPLSRDVEAVPAADAAAWLTKAMAA
jgi:hypothetical protein